MSDKVPALADLTPAQGEFLGKLMSYTGGIDPEMTMGEVRKIMVSLGESTESPNEDEPKCECGCGFYLHGFNMRCAGCQCEKFIAVAMPTESPSEDKMYQVRSGNASVPERFSLPDAMAEAALQLAHYGTVTIRESDPDPTEPDA